MSRAKLSLRKEVIVLEWNPLSTLFTPLQLFFLLYFHNSNNHRVSAAVKSQLENTREIMETDGKLTMSARHVKVTVSQWKEVTEVTGQCFLVRVYCEETTRCLIAN